MLMKPILEVRNLTKIYEGGVLANHEVNFSVEEENLICMYHTSDRRRTMARMLAALPDMNTEMLRLANGTIAKLEQMTDADFDGQRFDFTGE